MRAILILAAMIIAVPAVASAQDATERRRQQMEENFRQLEQNQRIGEVERQLSNMEIRRQSDDALRAIQAPAVTTYNNTYPLSGPTLQSNEEVRGLRLPAGAFNNSAYPLSSPAAPSLTSTLSGTTAPPFGASQENAARDAELAASNARLREIAQAQRSR